MTSEKAQIWLQTITNLAVLFGIVFVIIELRQNQADLSLTAAEWATSSSVAVWQTMASSQELADIEAKVRRGEQLTDVEYIRYEAYTWIRLEQVWSIYDAHRNGALSDMDYEVGIAPSRDRAGTDTVFARIIRDGPMPEELLQELLGGSR